MLTAAQQTPLHGARQEFITPFSCAFRAAEYFVWLCFGFLAALAAVSVARTARNSRWNKYRIHKPSTMDRYIMYPAAQTLFSELKNVV